MPSCAKCGKEIEIEERVMRRDECPHCGADLHSCVQCRFYSPGRHNDCAEPVSEPVSDKENANFCDWFSFEGGDGEAADGISETEKAKSALDALFKKS